MSSYDHEGPPKSKVKLQTAKPIKWDSPKTTYVYESYALVELDRENRSKIFNYYGKRGFRLVQIDKQNVAWFEGKERNGLKC